MGNENQGSFNSFSPSAIQAVEVLNRVRRMLWAGDYGRARAELEELNRIQGQKIEQALELRAEVIRKELERRREEREHFQEGQPPLPGIEAPPKQKSEREAWLAFRAAKTSHDLIEGNEDLFMLGAIATILAKLDKRIIRVTGGEPTFPHEVQRLLTAGDSEVERDEQAPSLAITETFQDEESGFWCVQIQRDDMNWEWRAYRPNPKSKSIDQIEKDLAAIKGLGLSLFDSSEVDHEKTWPYRFRGFSSTASVQVTVFDPNRVLIEIIAKQRFEPITYLKAIFQALS